MAFSGHYNVWSDLHQCYVSSALAPPPNARTLSHIVGVPNHVRAWKTSFYNQIGRHNPRLAVADDYELLLRSYLKGKWCHIRACGYYQYRNSSGNTTFTRNRLIQHNTYHVYQHYRSQLPIIDESKPIQPEWKLDQWSYPMTHCQYIPPEYRYEGHLELIDPTHEQLIMALNSLKPNWHLYVIGDINDLTPEQSRLVTWWNLNRTRCHHSRQSQVPP